MKTWRWSSGRAAIAFLEAGPLLVGGHLRGSALGFRNLTNYITRKPARDLGASDYDYTLDSDEAAYEDRWMRVSDELSRAGLVGPARLSV